MEIPAGGAALRESVTIDEVAHIGAGVSHLQTLELRLNEEHPPLPKVLAAIPLVLRGLMWFTRWQSGCTAHNTTHWGELLPPETRLAPEGI